MANAPQQPVSYAAQDGVAELQQGVNQTPAFFLANYRLGKTLGNGSFGKVSAGYLTTTHGFLPVAELEKRLHRDAAAASACEAAREDLQKITCWNLRMDTLWLMASGEDSRACADPAQGGYQNLE